MTIRLSGELAKNLLERAPDATVIVDANGTIVFANAQIERTFGYSPSELEGKPVETLLPQASRSRHVAHRARFSTRPKARRMGDGSTLFGRHKSGQEFPLEISLSPVQSEAGMLVVAAVRDATSRHDAERELVEANRAKSRLLAGASHDLRQPVQTLTLLNQAALRYADAANPKLASILSQQQVALDTISSLLASVLDVSKLDSGAVHPTIVDCAINDVFERLGSDFGPLADDKGIALIVEPTSEGGRTDPELLRRMLGNLVSNAIRYTGTGSVAVSCERRGDALALTVRDTGIGIPEDDLGKVFEEFYQVDRGPRRPDGLGLGLSIVRRLAALLGHEIGIDSVVAEGTIFTITLPRVELSETDTHSAPRAALNHKGTILIVDDEAPVAHATSLLLELEGFDVHVASCKSEALERARAAAPDLIISDYHLRGTETGAEVVDELRDWLGMQVPVIFVTGDTSKLARASTKLAKATLLSKPTQVDDLLAAIQHHIGHDAARA